MHRGSRLVLAVGVALGVLMAANMLFAQRSLVASSYLVYHHAALAALAGESIYAAPPPGLPSFTYMYPPATVLVYVPFTFLPWEVGFALQTLATLLGVGVLTLLCVRTVRGLGVELSRLDVGLIAGFCLLAPTAFPSVAFGNVNLLLAAGIGVGLSALEYGRDSAAGFALGAVASVKAFPFLVGVWLLRRRSSAGVATALGTGLGVLAVGVVVFGVDTTLHYFTEVLLPRGGEGESVAVSDPYRAFLTLHRPLLLLIEAGTLALVALSIALLAPFVGYCYTTVETLLDRLVAAFATVAATLLVVPSFYVYFPLVFYPLVCLLFALRGRPRTLVFAGTVLGCLTVTLGTVESAAAALPATVGSVIVGGSRTLFTVVTPPTLGLVIALAGCCLYVRNRRSGVHSGHIQFAPEESQPA